MAKNMQKSSYYVKKSHLLGKNTLICAIFLFILLGGCAKPATQTITDSALQQVNAIEHSITAECKTTAVTGQINALRGTIKSQLSACESEKSELKSDIARWKIISGALFGLLLLLLYIKILRK